MKSSNSPVFEVCANGVESCLAAQEGGAQRVELCAGIPEGGTTPSYGEMLVARRLLTACKLHVIIRPRGGDFVYSELELERMVADIEMAQKIGVDGIVVGCLTTDGKVDKDACQRLLQHAEGLSTTFHRAFDRTADPEQALEDIIALGFDRLLTSGQQPTAAEGVALLRRLHTQADGRIAIMAGAGVNEWNIAEIQQTTGINEFHFSARTNLSTPTLKHPQVKMGSSMIDETLRQQTSVERVRKTIAALTD